MQRPASRWLNFFGGDRLSEIFQKRMDFGESKKSSLHLTFFNTKSVSYPPILEVWKDQIRWLRPASAQVSVGGSSGTPIHMLCPIFLVIICHFSEDPFWCPAFLLFFFPKDLAKGVS